MLTVGFTGTRNGMTEEQERMLMWFLLDLDPGKFRHGDCLGSDKQSHLLVRDILKRCFIEIHPPTNPKLRAFCEGDLVHEPKEYKTRDRDIVDKSNIMIGCPKLMESEQWSGTWYTLRYALETYQQLNLTGEKREVITIWPNGTYECWPKRDEF